MKKEIRLTVGKLLLIVLIMLGFNILSSSASTNYAISALKIGYTDNSSLGADNVQAAIDGTCTKFNTQLTNLKDDIVDTMWPVGSIYTSETESSADDVQNRFKTFGKDTTWEEYGAGKVLVGSGTGTDSNGTSQTFSVANNSKNLGEYSHKLSIAELASHYHRVGIVSDNSVASMNVWEAPKSELGTWSLGWYDRGASVVYGVNESNKAGGYTQTVGENEFHNNISPYITVYMYKRTK